MKKKTKQAKKKKTRGKEAGSATTYEKEIIEKIYFESNT